MSQANVEIMRRFYDAWTRGDLDVGLSMLDPEIEWCPIEENRVPLHGVEAAVQNRNAWLDTWDDHRIELEEMIDAGDHVIATIHIVASGKSSGITTDVRFYAHIKMKDHQIVYIFDHRDRTSALQAVGLAE